MNVYNGSKVYQNTKQNIIKIIMKSYQCYLTDCSTVLVETNYLSIKAYKLGMGRVGGSQPP